ncbi:MAG: hypothetical protein NTZ59_15240 [Bacteroidetes bacterium]|nr:hypothetical protein [Bacteroidota bacterium]
MTHAAKLVWNKDNWVKPSGLAQEGVLVTSENPYYYGLEEWLNNKTLKNNTIGYLDCYRANEYNDIADIMLFTLNFEDNNIYHVGNICKVSQILNTNIPPIKTMLTNNWLINPIDADFVRIEGLPPSVGMPIYRQNNWNTSNIVSSPPTGFMVNIKYEKLVIFNKKDWVNVTEMDSKINTQWKHLGTRYILANTKFNVKLTNYLSGIKCHF